MKRDMDIIRRIAIETADMGPGLVLTGLDDMDKLTFGLHAIWMDEAGLITANIQEFKSGEPPKVQIRRLTWEGCEFVETIRSETLWKKAKESVIQPTASFTFSLLKDWLAAQIKQGLPPLG